ncbi:hypothetical protein [Halobacillus sp. H74]|uniref:hypothetical protein n=1 Tax=Halobacillus sp. H74 TaxID=3457436 RepID=UPI003FCC82E4
MIDYVDPIPPITRFLELFFEDVRVYGNTFPMNVSPPCLLVRTAGGTNYTRVQLIARADRDFEAMGLLIRAMNHMERSAQAIKEVDVLWCSKESLPISDTDTDTGAAEAWCYMRLEHMEA